MNERHKWSTDPEGDDESVLPWRGRRENQPPNITTGRGIRGARLRTTWSSKQPDGRRYSASSDSSENPGDGPRMPVEVALAIWQPRASPMLVAALGKLSLPREGRICDGASAAILPRRNQSAAGVSPAAVRPPGAPLNGSDFCSSQRQAGPPNELPRKGTSEKSRRRGQSGARISNAEGKNYG